MEESTNDWSACYVAHSISEFCRIIEIFRSMSAVKLTEKKTHTIVQIRGLILSFIFLMRQKALIQK